ERGPVGDRAEPDRGRRPVDGDLREPPARAQLERQEKVPGASCGREVPRILASLPAVEEHEAGEGSARTAQDDDVPVVEAERSRDLTGTNDRPGDGAVGTARGVADVGPGTNEPLARQDGVERVTHGRRRG